jgi:hypothetical protein
MIKGKGAACGQGTKKWSGALENYTLMEKNGKTELVVKLDTENRYKEYFQKTFSPALEK